MISKLFAKLAIFSKLATSEVTCREQVTAKPDTTPATGLFSGSGDWHPRNHLNRIYARRLLGEYNRCTAAS